MKKTRFKRIVSVALALCLITALLTGCGGKNKDEDEEELSQYLYVPEFVPVDEKVCNIQDIQMLGDRVYFTQYKQTSGPKIDQETAYENLTEEMQEKGQIYAADGSVVNYNDITYGQVLSSFKTDGTDLKELKDYKPVKIENQNQNMYSNIEGYSVDEEGNIVVCEEISVPIFNLPDGFDETQGDMYEYRVGQEEHVYIRHLDGTGKEISCVDLYDGLKDVAQSGNGQNSDFYVHNVTLDKVGNVYVNAGEDGIFIFDKEGKKLTNIETDTWIDNIFLDDEGNAMATVRGDKGQNIAKIDIQKGDFTDEVPMPNNLYQITEGSGEYEFLSNNGSSLYGFNSGEEEATEILNWLNSDVDADQVQDVKILDDGRILALVRNDIMCYGPMYDEEEIEEYPDEPTLYLVYLTKTPRSELKEKTTLKLACMYDYEIRREIMNFNKKSDTTRIEVVDYSKFATDEDYMAGLTKLNTQIISGDVPDLILLDQLPYQQYVAKGLLEDLYPYIEKDDELSTEDFIPNLLKVQEIDGKLYQASPSCSINTLVSSENVVGNEIGWTMQEMLDTIKRFPDVKKPFGNYFTRQSMIQQILPMQLSDYVDWSTGECNFKNEEFRRLVEFIKTFPEDYPEENQCSEVDEYISPYEMIMNGEQLFDISQFNLDSMAQDRTFFGDSYIYKGIPCSDKSGNIASFNTSIAITSSCKDKEAAWELVRTVLTEKFQKKQCWGVPTRQDVLEKQIKYKLKESENGSSCSVGVGNTMVDILPLEQRDVDKYRQGIDSVTKCSQYDDEILSIVSEETEAYFSGQKTIDDIIEIIQSRVTLYVNEQK